MLVECPNCHRKYEPKPNEKYCPCCGEEVSGKLIPVEEPKKESAPQVTNSGAAATYSAPKKSGLFCLIGTLLGLFSFLFMFGSAFQGGTVSLFQLTFFTKHYESGAKNASNYVGLIIAFVIYAILVVILIYNLVKYLQGEYTRGRNFAAVVEVFLIAFYIIYLLVKFKTEYNSGYSTDKAVTMPMFAPCLIMFLGSLLVSAVLNIVSIKTEN